MLLIVVTVQVKLVTSRKKHAWRKTKRTVIKTHKHTEIYYVSNNGTLCYHPNYGFVQNLIIGRHPMSKIMSKIKVKIFDNKRQT